MQGIEREAELVRKPAGILSFFCELEPVGWESGLDQLCDKLAVYSAGDGSNGRCAAVETGDLTQVSLGSLRLQHGEDCGCEGSGRRTRREVLEVAEAVGFWVGLLGVAAKIF